jgi:hypothetical protein
MSRPSNATVLGVAPLWQTLPVVGAVLVALFVMMKPESTAGFAFFERLAFWAVHIGLGLASIGLASRLLRPWLLSAMPLVVAILLTSLAGAAILAPIYLGIEGLVPERLQGPPDDWLDLFAARGLLQALVAEFIEVTPVFMVSWFAVNLPLLFARGEATGGPPDGPGGYPGRSSEAPATDEADIERSAFLARLPRVVGSDIVAISSDMHYLHVYTVLGKCMILGTLRDASAALGAGGMLVHRSHWVAHAHVQRLIRHGQKWECEMSNGLRIPVSRRNRQAVLEWHGGNAQVVRLAHRQPRKRVGKA